MIAGLFAVDQKNGIGYNGRMPWPLNKDDMTWFKRTTQNQVVVMGRKTWDSSDMPNPLPNRVNVLFTNNFIDNDDIEQIRGDVCEALEALQKCYSNKKIFVIGGANLLEQSRPMLEKLYITRIPGEYLSDVSIDLQQFLTGFSLVKTINLGSCNIEEYINENLSR